MENLNCPVCGSEKKPKNKYCSFKCNNIVINKNKDYSIQNKKAGKTKSENSKLKEIIIERNCKCGVIFKVKTNGKGKGFLKQFCSRKCANSRIMTEDKRLKISVGNKKSEKLKIANSIGRGRIRRNNLCSCKYCKITYSTLNRKTYCSDECKRKSKIKDYTQLKYYKTAASFKFNLATYKNEFNFGLIDLFGWYKAKNNGDNLGGVSRDHIFSVNEGFKRNINPLILAHPANCRLMIHTDNISKNKKSDITLEDLLEKIKLFDLKYGNFYKEYININMR